MNVLREGGSRDGEDERERGQGKKAYGGGAAGEGEERWGGEPTMGGWSVSEK